MIKQTAEFEFQVLYLLLAGIGIIQDGENNGIEPKNVLFEQGLFDDIEPLYMRVDLMALKLLFLRLIHDEDK